MKSIKFLIVALALLCQLNVMASVEFEFSPGTIDEGILKTRMENNISALLTEINRAGSRGTALNLTNISMEQGAKDRLNTFWTEASRFVCDRQTNITQCLNDYQGYQVRRIPITMKPVDNTYGQSLNRELTISLNKKGVITGVRPALESQEDVSIILGKGGYGVTDSRMRLEVLKWVEDFRCYYNEKDIKSIEQLFSEDALIIIGSVVATNTKRRRGDYSGMAIEQKVKYKRRSKEKYIRELTNAFNSNCRINVVFENIAVVRHPAKPNYYGVTLHQKWNGDSYHDEGWLFLLWDFDDPEKPQIHVRTWQSDEVAAEYGKFTFDDFELP